MADHDLDDNHYFFDGDIFIYMGGRAPRHITHARIDKFVIEIDEDAFNGCRNLVQVDTHDGIRKVRRNAFWACYSLRRINLKSVIEIVGQAFGFCEKLESVEFGDRLETIGYSAFCKCKSLTHIKLPSIITIERCAFEDCKRLVDIEMSERLETMGSSAFDGCHRLQRIAIPLKRGLFEFDIVNQKYNQFDRCEQLVKVDLVGQAAHTQTIASLHMESWRTRMITEINRINQVLPNAPDDKTEEIWYWMDSFFDEIDHYKVEHGRYVREGITLLKLALWKAKLGEKEEYECKAEGKTKKAKVDVESARKDKRMICGADMVINNVLPFLQLE